MPTPKQIAGRSRPSPKKKGRHSRRPKVTSHECSQRESQRRIAQGRGERLRKKRPRQKGRAKDWVGALPGEGDRKCSLVSELRAANLDGQAIPKRKMAPRRQGQV